MAMEALIIAQRAKSGEDPADRTLMVDSKLPLQKAGLSALL